MRLYAVIFNIVYRSDYHTIENNILLNWRKYKGILLKLSLNCETSNTKIV